jgi:arylsulfatase A-like enzyme
MRATRRDFILACGFLAWPAALAAAQPTGLIGSEGEAGPRPNVVLVVTDTAAFLDSASHGDRVVKTPHLDWLYAQSTRLTDFHVDPFSSPTRAALLTGRYAARGGVWAENMGRSLLRADETTMADLFAAAGYRTGMFGKWHLGDNCPFRPQDRGFQETLVLGGGGIGQTPDFWGNQGRDDTYFRNGRAEKCAGSSVDVFFSEALKFIQRNQRQPFFCYLAPPWPYGPHLVDAHSGGPYRHLDLPQPTAEFYAAIANFDENLGRLVNQLDELSLADRTILLVMPDRATEACGQGGRQAGKVAPDEAWHRAFCLLRWPGHFAPGRDVGTLAAHVDLLPTLVELCSLQKHGEPIAFDGASLVPLLGGREDVEWPERILIIDRQRPEPVKWSGAVVMAGRWRLVGRDRLYDLQADPEEKVNVTREHGDVMDELLRAYERWWTQSFEPAPEPCAIRIGSDRENPVRLTAFDWSRTGAEVPWRQDQVRDDEFFANGSWAIEVAREGNYRFTLRRFPVEESRPIGADAAWLKVGHVEVTAAIPQGATEVRHELWLAAGKTRLETKFTDKRTGRFRGAYFVYVERLP